MNQQPSHHPLIATVFLLMFALAVNAQHIPSQATVLEVAMDEGPLIWQKVKPKGEPDPSLTARDIFTYALVLCETNTHLDRLPRLFDLLVQMQDRDPQSRGYGNFLWNWFDAKVIDFNSVDFCMRSGTLLWIKHRSALPDAMRQQLHELLTYAVEGCMRHQVGPAYSNIALMNAGNLILLGEVLEKPEVAKEGYARLNTAFQYIHDIGIHEYVSPTYYGTDLDALVVMEAFCRQQHGRKQVRALLELFWTDIAYNWHPSLNRLTGAHSRSYDYLHGLGYLNTQLWRNGWYEQAPEQDIDAVYAAQAQWFPDSSIKQYASQFPRLVRERWGKDGQHSRTHFMQEDVTLSTAASTYGRIDVPMTVDGLDLSPTGVRCYFLADGRGDPYGKNKTAADAAHQKSIHLTPFFTAVQDESDALALVVYRDKDIPEEAPLLESHWVMPSHTDGFQINEQRIHLEEGKSVTFPLMSDASLLVHSGTAAMGVRVLWTRNRQGKSAPVALVYDGNPYGAVRLTVQHNDSLAKDSKALPGAAFWIRVGSGLETEEAFERWAREFTAGVPQVQASSEKIRLQVPDSTEPLVVEAQMPFDAPANLIPAPTKAVLEVNGEEVGKPILEKKGLSQSQR